jgi:hypothetical protein
MLTVGVPDFVDEVDDPNPLLRSPPAVAVPAAEEEEKDDKDCVALVVGTPNIGFVVTVTLVEDRDPVEEEDGVLITMDVDSALSTTVVVITLVVEAGGWEEEVGGEFPFVGS